MDLLGKYTGNKKENKVFYPEMPEEGTGAIVPLLGRYFNPIPVEGQIMPTIILPVPLDFGRCDVSATYVQVNNYEIVVNFFFISHNLT